MKRFFLSFLLAAVSLSLAAQSSAEYIKAMLAGNRVSFNYNLGVKGSAPVKMNGKAVIDGDCYSVVGNGIEMYCDGATKWVVDREAKEVYVESAEGTRDFLADTASWIGNVSDLKYGDGTASGTYFNEDQNVTFTFKFSSITPSPLSGSTAGFVFDTAALGSDWVITDLR